MTHSPEGQHRAPLLTRVLGANSREEANALASLAPAAAALDEGASLSICLELFAEVASLVGPHLKPVRIRNVSFSASPAPWRNPSVRGEARWQGPESLVQVRLAQSQGTAEWIATAEVELKEGSMAGPALQLADDRRVERRATALNAIALYSAPELNVDVGRPLGQALQWAESLGLGQLGGGIGNRGPHFGTFSPSLPLASSPGVVESLFQLVQWQWYALTGEGATVLGLEDALWYRLPRAEEPLIGHVRCRGSRDGAASFDAIVYGSDNRVCVELCGLRILPRPLAVEGVPLPRVDWQSFVSALGDMGRAGPS